MFGRWLGSYPHVSFVRSGLTCFLPPLERSDLLPRVLQQRYAQRPGITTASYGTTYVRRTRTSKRNLLIKNWKAISRNGVPQASVSFFLLHIILFYGYGLLKVTAPHIGSVFRRAQHLTIPGGGRASVPGFLLVPLVRNPSLCMPTPPFSLRPKTTSNVLRILPQQNSRPFNREKYKLTRRL